LLSIWKRKRKSRGGLRGYLLRDDYPIVCTPLWVRQYLARCILRRWVLTRAFCIAARGSDDRRRLLPMENPLQPKAAGIRLAEVTHTKGSSRPRRWASLLLLCITDQPSRVTAQRPATETSDLAIRRFPSKLTPPWIANVAISGRVCPIPQQLADDGIANSDLGPLPSHNAEMRALGRNSILAGSSAGRVGQNLLA